MVSSAYDTPGEKLSQGDIVMNIPWGLVEAPLRICRPHQGDQVVRASKTPFGPPDDFADAFARAKSNNKEIIHAYGERGAGLVLWHSCQIDKFEEQRRKPESWFAGIAPILDIDKRLHPQDRAAVQNGEHRSYFYLPAVTFGGEALPDSFADLRHIWPVKQSLLADRLATLSVDMRLTLYDQLFTFFTRLRLKAEAPCPKCGSSVPVSSFAEEVEEAD